MAKIKLEQLPDRILLLNLYITQLLSLLIGLVWCYFANDHFWTVFKWGDTKTVLIGGIVFALAVLAVDYVASHFIPEDMTDDGGVNEKIFANRPIWHIVVISLVVAVCEEVLFRGGVQATIGPYWTSIVFATIHVRYLRHWIPTGLVFLISYGLGYLYIKTGSLWTPILAHFLIDCVLGLIVKYAKK